MSKFFALIRSRYSAILLEPTRVFYLAISLALLIVFTIFSLANPRFFTASNLLNVLRQASPTLISAVAMTIVITLSGIDLSIGSLLAVVAVLSAMALGAGWNALLVVVAVLIIGSGMGAVNGFFAAYQKIPAFIVTLATLSVYRGLALLLTHGYSLPIPPNSPFIFIGRGWVLGVPVPVWIALAVVIIGYIVFYKTPFGLYVTGIGSNEEAVRRAGVNVKRVKFWAYVLSGSLTAIAGMIVAARVAAGSSYIGVGFELTVIASVIVGGTNLFGGEGRMLGTVIGTLLLALISNGLVMIHVSAFYQQVVEGVILLLAIWFNKGASLLGNNKG